MLNSTIKLGIKKYIASPGSGKTQSLLGEIQKLLTQKIIKNCSEILVVMFSNATKEDFIKKMAKNPQLKKKMNSNQIVTFHSISGSIMKKMTNKSTKFIQLCIQSACNIIVDNKEEIRKVSKLAKVKHIFVDEAQDMSKAQYDLVMLLKESLNAHLTICGDPQQSIYEFSGSCSKYLLECPADELVHLNYNYRSQQNIVNILNKLQSAKKEPIICYKDLPMRPNILMIDRKEIILQKIEAIVADSLANNKTIGIIGSVKVGKQQNLGLQSVRNYLYERNYKLNVLYEINPSVDSKRAVQSIDKQVNLLTTHISKGLEYAVVVLIDFHFEYFNTKPDYENIEQMQNLFYVGLSRPQEQLYICCNVESKINPIYHQIKEHLLIDSSCNQKQIDICIKDQYTYHPHKKQIMQVKQVADKLATNSQTIGLLTEQIAEQTIVQKIVQLSEIPQNPNYYSDCQLMIGTFFEHLFTFYLDPREYIMHLQQQEQRTKYIHVTFQLPLGQNRLVCYDILDLQILQQHIGNRISKELYNSIRTQLNCQSIVVLYNNINLQSQLQCEIQSLSQQLNLDMNNNEMLIFKIKLYEHCLVWETIHLLEEKIYMEIFQAIQPHFINVCETTKHINTLDTQFTYQRYAKNTNIPNLYGIADIVGDRSLIEIKYQNDVNMQDYIQVMLYGLLIDPQDRLTRCVLNLKTCELVIIQINQQLKSKFIIECLCEAKLQIENTIIAIDFETTSLDPFSCDVIDRCFKDVSLNLELSNGFVKPTQQIPQEIQTLTSITNEMAQSGDSIEVMKQDIDTMKQLYKSCIIKTDKKNKQHSIINHLQTLPIHIFYQFD